MVFLSVAVAVAVPIPTHWKIEKEVRAVTAIGIQ
jgi:hypothetical protein